MRMEERRGVDPRALPDDLLLATQPVVLRGLAAHWPAVAAGRGGAHAAAEHLWRHWRGATVGVLSGPPSIGGRFFYDDTLTQLNFQRHMVKLDQVLGKLMDHLDDPEPPAVYVGSTTVDTCLPGYRAENDLGFGPREPLMSIWLGNRTRIAAHFDLPANIAVVTAGRRRFTLFPPAQAPNLYVGPLDLTPAGQPISLVDVAHPDLQRFPRYAQALEHAHVAELEPGDAVLIPSLWWHAVDALQPFNVLVNYWWRESPAHMDSPMATLLLALLTLRDLPPEQRRAWRALLDHYVFEPGEATAGHIPPPARGSLGPLDDTAARALRAQVLKRLNR